MSNTVDSQRTAEDPVPAKAAIGTWIVRLLIAAVAITALVFIGKAGGGYVQQFATWVESLGPWGPIVFILGYALFTVAFIPGSFLTLAGGALFGLWGTLYVFAGATLGAAAAFLVSRYVARGAIEKKLEGNEKFAVIDKAVAGQGRKIVFLLRLSPIFPFNLLNYGLGLTKVRFLDYLVASIGMIPGTFLYVYYGKAAGDLAALAAGAQPEQGAEKWIFMGVGLLATVVVTAVVTRIASRALKEATSDV